MDRCYILYDNWWWELVKIKNGKKCTYRCINETGGGFDLEEKRFSSICKKYRLAVASDKFELDWKGTCVYDNSYETGWVDRQGNFYGCDYRQHFAQALCVHKSTEIELEQKGWVKLTYCWGNKQKPLILYDHNTKPTKQQIDYIAGTRFIEDYTFMYLMEHCYE